MMVCHFSIAILSLQFTVTLGSPAHCPTTFTIFIEQSIEDLNVFANDPEQTFFKEVMGFRDRDIKHVKDDALKFFNETYGLDFSQASPNEQGRYVLDNKRLSMVRVPEDFHFYVASSNWIQTGSTRFTCHDVSIGAFIVDFTGDDLLHGSYGGVDGRPVGAGNIVEYGFFNIDICNQSPIIIQYSNSAPFRLEPIDGTGIAHFDVYNNVLGYGKAVETPVIRPDYANPGKYTLSNRIVFTFPDL